MCYSAGAATWVPLHGAVSGALGMQHVLAHTPLGAAGGLRPSQYAGVPHVAGDGASTAERAADPLTWLVFVAAADAGQAELYEDSGDGYEFEQGDNSDRTRVNSALRFGDSLEFQFDAQLGRVRRTPDDASSWTYAGVAQPGRVLVRRRSRSRPWEHAATRLQIRLPRTPAARSVSVEACDRVIV